ncbi:hypothetical protein D9V37_08305 [Nocardioides mangrovicus]|uniref:Uncharacterized protein n=1 Tax=Nocardioides mangrovicus TaxID=2478913 RepID=A0A3L8P5G6_9ACTN|nr:hypothetical protein D9V37_08305 [Nocardioides mangrovicus]
MRRRPAPHPRHADGDVGPSRRPADPAHERSALRAGTADDQPPRHVLRAHLRALPHRPDAGLGPRTGAAPRGRHDRSPRRHGAGPRRGRRRGRPVAGRR